MSNSLLEEAIVDAQKLRELAEQTAKNRIIEVVMPQIREMVNRRILGESLEELAQEEMTTEEEEVAEASDPERQEESEEETKEEAPVATEPAKVGETVNELFESVKKTKILTESVASIEAKVSKIAFLIEDATFLKENAEVIANKIIDTTEEAVNLTASMNLNENSTNDSLSKRLDRSIKELKDMSRKNRSIFDFLFEGQELNEAELKLELGDEDKETLGDKYDEVIEMLRAAGLEVEAEEGEEGPEALEGEEGPEAPEGEELEAPETEEGEELEGEEPVKAERYMVDEEMEEGMYEIDEAILRRELRRIRENAAAEQADQFGGGEALGDVILDIDEEDLINVLADELGKYQGVKEPVLPESRQTAGPTVRERQLQRQLKEARTEAADARQANAKLQQQLQEMNLFNAKLLYANKLMQNKELTVKQQKTVVEALDNAKTLREAKLLFESLTESLTRKPAAAGSLKEGMTRTFGSSSKSTRSAAPANASGVDSDRWAILAGIGKG
jgi:hypothetical protein